MDTYEWMSFGDVADVEYGMLLTVGRIPEGTYAEIAEFRR